MAEIKEIGQAAKAPKPHAPNPAIAVWFQFEYHWRGVSDAGRWATMRIFWATGILGVLIFVTGCYRSGDVGEFLNAEIIRCGGHTVTNAGFPQISGTWTVKRDANGFTATVRNVSFTQIDSWMHHAFGLVNRLYRCRMSFGKALDIPHL